MRKRSSQGFALIVVPAPRLWHRTTFNAVQTAELRAKAAEENAAVVALPDLGLSVSDDTLFQQAALSTLAKPCLSR